MTTKQLTILLIGFLAATGLLYVLSSSAGVHESSTATSSPINDPSVSAIVEQFGGSLKQVSLLAPAADVDLAMDAAYGPYLTPELLAAWKANPDAALGRTTSSPWPDRITVASTDVRDPSATVEGAVIEVAQGSDGVAIVGTYPVTLQLEHRASGWRIAAVQKGAYSNIPSRTTLRGTYTCLPHRDTSGPQTAECALGMIDDTTVKYYSIDTRLLESTTWQGLLTGAHIEVSGVLTPVEMLSSIQKYDIAGIISATTIRRIE